MRRGFGTRGTSDGPSGRNARRWGRARCALRTGGIACLLLLDFLRIGDAHAQERLVRRYAADEGLAVPPVTALAQDRQGFLWIGAVGGLYRFDGVEFRRWAPDRLAGAIAQLAAAPDDARLAVQGVDGRIFEIDDGLVSLLPPPRAGGPPPSRHSRTTHAAASGPRRRTARSPCGTAPHGLRTRARSSAEKRSANSARRGARSSS